MKKTTLFLAVMLMTVAAMAQVKVAILETVDKAQNVGYGVKLLLRSSLTSAISNTPGYEGYDRVDMASIAGEQEFQRTGNVSDNQIKQLGVATGAQYVLVAEAAKYDETSIIITAKLLDVETFGVKSSAVVVSGIGARDMQQSCSSLASQLLTISKPAPAAAPAVAAPAPAKPAAAQPATPSVSKATAVPMAVGSTQLAPNPLAQLSDGSVLYVAASDEEDRMEYSVAVTTCSCKGSGWRLPTVDELKILEGNKNQYSDIHTSYRYWAQEGGVTVDMSTGYKVKTKNSVKAKVRCVKVEK